MVPPAARSPWSDLDRPPLSAQRLARALTGPGGWRRVDVVDSTASTNADLVAAAAAGEAAGLVRIAEEQSAGRGRVDRRWEAPPRSGLLLSVLLRPTCPAATWSLLPLLAGLAVVEAARTVGRVPAELKWPNDVVVEGRKLGGILVERVDMAVVVGVGLNVTLRRAELPVPTATSLALEAGGTDREALVKEVLRALARRLAAWEAADGAPESILPAYRSICATIGQHVSVSLPGGSEIVGCVTGVDDTGRLVVDVGGTSRVVAAGDVVHVRPGV